MFAVLFVAAALDQRASVAVDAAGHLSEHLRVDATNTGSWCENTDFDNMYKRGCGMCASSCNKEQLKMSSDHPDDNSQVIDFDAQMECWNQCNPENGTRCTAISFDMLLSKCTLHYSMPVGAICGTGENAACGANPHNTGDVIAQTRLERCGDQACFINEAQFREHSQIERLGHGSCHRGEVAGNQPGGMIVVKDIILGGAASVDGLTPGTSPACSSPDADQNECWPPAAQVSLCMAECENDSKCRSFNLGKRFKSCTGTCDYATQPGEYYCTLLGVTPTYASTNINDQRELGCAAYGSIQSRSTTQINVEEYSECTAPFGPDCYVLTTRAQNDFISRGAGLCTGDDGKEATFLAHMAPPANTMFDVVACQNNCKLNEACVGVSHGITSDADLTVQSYCYLHQQCNATDAGSDCSRYEQGESITSSSKELLAAKFCADKCGGSYNDDGTIDTEPTACSCSSAGPNGDGWRSDAGDANWRDGAVNKFACCEIGNPAEPTACKVCMDSYSSECFAYARV